jgi:predicted ATPase
MLTELRFKNWRSLRDVTIELTPITVFIGANSSGKTNILDALYFLRYAMDNDLAQAMYLWTKISKIPTANAPENKTELGFTYRFQKDIIQVHLQLDFNNIDASKAIFDTGKKTYTLTAHSSLQSIANLPATLRKLQKFIVERWQLLNPNFKAPLTVSHPQITSFYQIDPYAENLLWILDFMRQFHPTVYAQIQEDLKWLLKHVKGFRLEPNNYGLELRIDELRGEAPSISAGTVRVLTMLTVGYIPDIHDTKLPSLIMIEEPQNILNPWLLTKWEAQLRYFLGSDNSRQIILTTHSPSFLNCFKPEEVRVVERDNEGFITVSIIPHYIQEIWLDKYGLGEVWMTNSFGGLGY